MPLALICASRILDAELSMTPIWRRSFERHTARSLEESREVALARRPEIVIVDRDADWADRLVSELRANPRTRDLTIIALAQGPVSAREEDLVEAGCDAVLRMPGGGAWDERLSRYIDLPLRRDARLPVQLRVDAQVADDLVSALILNLSQRGMLIQSPVPLQVGHDVEFAFALPGQSRLVNGSGRVAREATPTQFGIEFLVLDHEDRARLTEFLERHAPA
jgi:hypothetical protein